MSGFLSLSGSFLDAVAATFKAAIALLLLTMLGINTANILNRALSGAAYDWVFHWTLLMFVWMTCLGVYVYMRENRDVVVDLIATRLPLGLRRILAVFADLVGLLFMYMVLSPALELTAMQRGHMETIALPIYVTSLPLFVAAACLVLHFCQHALQVLNGDIVPYPPAHTNELTQTGPAK